MSDIRFFRSAANNTIIAAFGNVDLGDTGHPMEALVPNVTDASGEKHLPVVRVEGDRVCVDVGRVEHPMAEEHWIDWVWLQTDKGGHRKVIRPGDPPQVTFALAEERPLAAYAYCNLHGLWKTEI